MGIEKCNKSLQRHGHGLLRAEKPILVPSHRKPWGLIRLHIMFFSMIWVWGRHFIFGFGFSRFSLNILMFYGPAISVSIINNHNHTPRCSHSSHRRFSQAAFVG